MRTSEQKGTIVPSAEGECILLFITICRSTKYIDLVQPPQNIVRSDFLLAVGGGVPKWGLVWALLTIVLEVFGGGMWETLPLKAHESSHVELAEFAVLLLCRPSSKFLAHVFGSS